MGPDFTQPSMCKIIFESLFSGGGLPIIFGGGGRGGRRGPRREVPTLKCPLSISFMEAAHGVTKTITVPRRVTCETCGGDG